ncbi:MAG TPA: hypothetical protein ENN36_10100 [Candidatus Bathyarchaeota archaeon]|nr:hypothetical protein [Candidatus Bathyarchaeota archaeon]
MKKNPGIYLTRSEKKSKHLTPSEKKTLHYIIEHGSTYAYELGMTKKILGTEKTANVALNNLARKRLLHKKAIKAGKPKRERQMYTLSLRGLCEALVELDLLDEDPEWLKEKWGHLLPLLNKLPLFDKNLFWTCLSMAWEEARPMTVIFDDAHVAVIIEEKFCEKIYEVTRYSQDGMIEIDKILHADPEFRKRVRDCLRKRRAIDVVNAKIITERINLVFSELEKSEPDWNKIKDAEKLIYRHYWLCTYEKEVLFDLLESQFLQWLKRIKLGNVKDWNKLSAQKLRETVEKSVEC